jgi:flagellar biosynthesis GTPase FlhF
LKELIILLKIQLKLNKSLNTRPSRNITRVWELKINKKLKNKEEPDFLKKILLTNWKKKNFSTSRPRKKSDKLKLTIPRLETKPSLPEVTIRLLSPVKKLNCWDSKPAWSKSPIPTDLPEEMTETTEMIETTETIEDKKEDLKEPPPPLKDNRKVNKRKEDNNKTSNSKEEEKTTETEEETEEEVTEEDNNKEEKEEKTTETTTIEELEETREELEVEREETEVSIPILMNSQLSDEWLVFRNFRTSEKIIEKIMMERIK